MGLLELVLVAAFILGLVLLWSIWRDEAAPLRAERRVVAVVSYGSSEVTPKSRAAHVAEDLGRGGLARLRRRLAEEQLQKLQHKWVHASQGDLDVLVLGATSSQAKYWLRRQLSADVRLRWASASQALSMRRLLLESIENAQAEGVKQILLLFGDMPLVKVEDVEATFRALGSPSSEGSEGGGAQLDASIVIGGSEGAGCPLLGLHLARLGDHLPALFDAEAAVPWEAADDGLLQESLTREGERLGLTLTTLPAAVRQVTAANLHQVESELGVERPSELRQPTLSVIVPALNEESNIEEVLLALSAGASDSIEIVLSDGESEDATIERARALTTGESWPSRVTVKIVQGPKGRGRQLNRGAAASSGDVLLFVHADTRLPSGYDQAVLSVLDTLGVVCGAFSFGVDAGREGVGGSLSSSAASSSSSSSSCPSSGESTATEDSPFFIWRMRALEYGTNLRARNLELPYGDQALSVTRSTFTSLGGFADQPLLEDVDFVRRLQKRGHVAVMDEVAVTSARRWRKSGWLMNTGFNQLILLAYAAGVPPETLAQWYYGRR